MNDSILTSVKGFLGIGEDDTSFDLIVTMHVNSTFSRLATLGVGPIDGFAIEDKTTEWADYLEGNKLRNDVKAYMCLKVKLLFDPGSVPASVITAMNEQIKEYEWLFVGPTV